MAGPVAKGVFPSGLERMLEVVAHAGGGVGIEAAHAGDLVAEALFGEDLGDAVLGHPGLVAVPEPVHGQAWLDRQPAGETYVVVDDLDASAARRRVAHASADGQAAMGRPGQVVTSAMTSFGGRAVFGFVASVARGAEDAAGVVAAPEVAAVGSEEEVPAASAVLGGAAAGRMLVVPDLAAEQAGQEKRQVDRETRLPGRAAVGVVLGREPVELAVEFAELPLDVDLAGVEAAAFEADRLALAQAGVRDGEDHGEVLVPARHQRGEREARSRTRAADAICCHSSLSGAELGSVTEMRSARGAELNGDLNDLDARPGSGAVHRLPDGELRAVDGQGVPSA